MFEIQCVVPVVSYIVGKTHNAPGVINGQIGQNAVYQSSWAIAHGAGLS